MPTPDDKRPMGDPLVNNPGQAPRSAQTTEPTDKTRVGASPRPATGQKEPDARRDDAAAPGRKNA